MSKTTWAIDPAHSEIHFKVRHLMITNVTGAFHKFEGTMEMDGEDLTTAHATFSADVNSLTTGNEQRDGHIKSPDFFDVANHPTITFTSTKIEKVDADSSFELYGDLTINGISKSVKLDVEFLGMPKDPWGNQKAGFTVNGTINRKDWNLNWNAALESGGVLVSDEVRIACELQLAKQA